MRDEEFDAYVSQIVRAAKSKDADELVGNLLGEFGEKQYLTGQYALIDRLRFELDRSDLRRARLNEQGRTEGDR